MRPLKKLSDEQREVLLGIFRAGATDELAAAGAKIAIRTWYRMMQRDRKLREAVEAAKRQADGRVVKGLFDKAIAGDTTAMIFWLKNRDPRNWRDRHELDLLNAEKGKDLRFEAKLAGGDPLPSYAPGVPGAAPS